MQWWHIFQSAQMNFKCLWEVQNICVIYCSLPLLFLFHKMKEEVGGEAGMLIRNIISFQIFPWGFQMENIFFLYSSKVLLSFLSAVKPTFPIYFYFDKFITIFSAVLLLFKHPTIFKFILDCPFNSDERVKYDKTYFCNEKR